MASPPPKDRKPGRKGAPKKPGKSSSGSERYWLFGLHTVRAALDNPRRSYGRLLATRNAANALGTSPVEPEIVDRKKIDNLVRADAVHQGIALEVDPLPDAWLDDVLKDPPDLLVMLDQVTDPHNVGAILRSAAAFGAGAVITTLRHSPPETPVLAKSAAGAMELVPYVRLANLARGLERLGKEGYLRIGLEGEGDLTPGSLGTVLSPGMRCVLVLGAEGKGLRQLTRETCDVLLRLPIEAKVDSLNVSNAAAVALYVLREQMGGQMGKNDD
ncbi:MAG: 23S rRNA (guanosine(2251)-2'-O)-methyltransferase RlmB [Alphaproteobacteria bacterium]|nr:23S rRNA (guanosine(2251)-2'-O)-methyltransferase RlmB [Alphaproteobacteria bacterium]